MREFARLLRASEDWLVTRVLEYARERGYARHTTALRMDWRAAVRGFTETVLAALPGGLAGVDMGPDHGADGNPVTAFAVEAARRHRARGVELGMFLGLLSYYRQSYLDLAAGADGAGLADREEREDAGRFLARFFDRVATGVAVEWCALGEDARLAELRSGNARAVTEKNRYRTVFEALPDPAVFVGTDGALLGMNDACARWLGPLAGEAQGRPAAELLPWLAGDLAQALAGGGDDKAPFLDREAMAGGGERRSVRVRLKPLKDVTGALTGLVALIEDITDLARATAARQAVDALLRDRLREISSLAELDGILDNPDLDLDTALEQVAAAIPRGLEPPGGMEARIRLDGRTCGPAADETRPCLRHPLTIAGRERGEVALCGAAPGASAPADAASGHLAAVAALLGRGIAARLSKTVLARSEKLFREFFDNAADAIFIHDEAGGVLDANKGAGIWLNTATESLRGKSLLDWAAEADREIMLGRFRDALRGNAALFQATLTRRDGFAIPVEMLSQAIDYQGRRSVVSSGRNISARLRAQGEIERRLALEAMVAGISSRIINTSAAQMDQAIARSLADLCGFVSMDRAGVFLLEPARGRYRLVHKWREPGAPQLPGALKGLSPARMPWLAERISALERVSIRDTRQMPPAGHREKALLAAAGIASLAAVPMAVGGRLLGVLAVASQTPRDHGRASDAQLLDQVALLLANALEKGRVNEALRESEGLSRAIIESLSANICVLDRNGLVTMVNRHWTRFAQENTPPGLPLFGAGADYLDICRRAAAAGEPLAAQAEDGIRAVLEGKSGAFRLEYPCHSPQAQRWFVLQVTPFAERRRGGAVIAHRDITERALALQKLRQSEERFRIIVETAQEAVLQVDTAARILYANPRVQSMFGYTPEELLGQSLEFILDPGDAALLHQKLKRRRQGLSDQYELRFRHKGGKRIWTMVNASPLRDREGAVAGSIGMITDISDRMRAEGRLRKNEARYRTLVEAMHEGLIMTRKGGRISFANDQFADMLGRPKASLVGRPAMEFAVPESAALLERLLTANAAGAEQAPGTQEVLWTHASGRRIYTLVSPSLVRDDEGKGTGTFAVITDTTERKGLESQLLHSQKLEAIGQLAAGIAHEINTPAQYVGNNIQFIKGAFEDVMAVCLGAREFVERSKTACPGPVEIAALERLVEERDVAYLAAEVPGAISQTMEGVERISTIVRSVKQFAHPGEAVMAPADLNEAMKSTVTVSRNEWKYVAELVTDLDEALPLVVCMIGEINQVVLNLIVNAAHAIAEAQKADPGRKGLITLATRRRGPWAEISVSDTGAGIPEAAQAKIFDPFFTTKEVGKGTGQGLTISRSIVVEKHKGQLFFETEPGRGTTFVVRLPLEPDQERRQGRTGLREGQTH